MPLDKFSRTKAHLVSFLSGVISALDETDFDGADAKPPHPRYASPLELFEPQPQNAGGIIGSSSPLQNTRSPSAINIHIGSLSSDNGQTASEKVTSSLAAIRTRLTQSRKR